MRTFTIARVLLSLFAIGLALCLAFAANAQTRPPFPLAGTFTDQLLDEWNKCRAQNLTLLDQNRLLTDSLYRSRSLLTATREAYKKLDGYRLARIDSLIRVANQNVDDQYQMRVNAEADAVALRTFIDDLYKSLLTERARDTAFGIGRRRWLKQAQRQIEEFLANQSKQQHAN